MNVQRELKTVNRRIRNTVSRGVVTLSDASKLLQTLQIGVLKDEVLSNVEHFEQLGFTSRPKNGAEVIVLSPGGNHSSAIAIMVSDRRVRLKNLLEGEVAIYDDVGNIVHLKQDGSIALTASTSVDFNVPEITTNGNLSVTGNITAGGDISAGGNVSAGGQVSDASGSMTEMRSAYNSHTHPGGGTPSVPMT